MKYDDPVSQRLYDVHLMLNQKNGAVFQLLYLLDKHAGIRAFRHQHDRSFGQIWRAYCGGSRAF
jgi:hypothetical protein